MPLLVATAAGAQSGLQVSPDGKRVLVSKDVGAERWAIARTAGDGSVTGNVFFPSGGNPRFVWCDQASSSADQITLNCSGSDRCLLAPCTPEAWAFLASVSLPLSFFQPRDTAALFSCHATAQLVPQAVPPASGLQLSPNRAVTLVSKDVGAERWAIARNSDDGSVTGNVFFPNGGNPRFVWCQETAQDGTDLKFSCEGADACGSTCSPSDWTFIADVTLPESFFTPRTQVALDELVTRVLETLGDDDGFVAILLGLDHGYSLGQILHAISDARLDKSGEIRLRSGIVEVPEGPPLGLFTETPSGPLAEKQSARALLEHLKETLPPSEASNLLISLLAKGYDLDQIAPALAMERWRWKGVFPSFTPYLVDERGLRIPPSGPFVDMIGPPGGSVCGNGQIDPGEDCDGDNLGDWRCEDFEGFSGGTLRCSACSWDSRDCMKGPHPTPPATCGNSVKDPGEVCDGEDFGGVTCESLGYPSGGKLYCNAADCTIDINRSCRCDGKLCDGVCLPKGSACCGDGVAEGDEQCDGADLRGSTCASLGFPSGGTLR